MPRHHYRIDVAAALLRLDSHICWFTSAAQRRDPASADLHATIERWLEPGATKQRHADSTESII